MLRVFLHGLDSSNQGTKSLFFREKYPDMLIPNFTGALEDRMEKLEHVLEGEGGLRIVGSSFGGLMAALFTLDKEPLVDRLILLAPAINMGPFSQSLKAPIKVPVTIFHGRNDEVIPLEEVKRIAWNRFQNLVFHELDDDHSLHKTFKTLGWSELLGEE